MKPISGWSLGSVRKLQEFWFAYSKNRASVFGLVLVLFFLLVALLAPFVTPYDPLKVGVAQSFLRPNWSHPFGSDNLGRDIYSGVVKGVGVTLLVGFSAAATSAMIGLLIGAISGYYGGGIDDLLMRITDSFQVIPTFFLALVMVALFGSNIGIVIFVIGVLGWPGVARVLRAEFLSLREQDFVEAAIALGVRNSKIIFSEILPSATPSLVVNTSLRISHAILIESGLSFLGLGDPNAFSLGLLLNNAQRFLLQAWWLPIFPGLATLLIVLSFNLVGDGLNDVLNPRTKR